SVATRGPLTPDHVIRTKPVPLVGNDVAGYAEAYRSYFTEHRVRRGVPLTMLDPAPRVLLHPAYGMLTAGPRATDADIAHDVDAPDYLGLQADVTDPAAVDDALRRGVERFGGIDLVVAAAGVFPGAKPLREFDPSAWRRTMAVNADAIAYLFGAVHPLL